MGQLTNRLILGQIPVCDQRNIFVLASAHAIKVLPVVGAAGLDVVGLQRPPGASVSANVERSIHAFGETSVINQTNLNPVPMAHPPVGESRNTKVLLSTQTVIRLVGTVIVRSSTINHLSLLLFGGQRPVFDKSITPLDPAAQAMRLLPVVGTARVVSGNRQRPSFASVSTRVETSAQRIGDHLVVDQTSLNVDPKAHLPVGLERKTRVLYSTQVLTTFAIGAALTLPPSSATTLVITTPKTKDNTAWHRIRLGKLILGVDTVNQG